MKGPNRDQAIEQYGSVFATDNSNLAGFRDRDGKAPESLDGSGGTDDAANFSCSTGF